MRHALIPGFALAATACGGEPRPRAIPVGEARLAVPGGNI